MTTSFKIAVLPGDGIGPDVIAEGVKVLRAVESKLSGVGFALEEFSVGAGEYLRNGDPLPPATLARCQEHHAILLGAMGLPDVRWPDGLEMTPQLDLRRSSISTAIASDPALSHQRHTPQACRGRSIRDRREYRRPFSGRQKPSNAAESTDRLRITRPGSGDFSVGVPRAKRRRGLVTLVDKANVLPSMAFFRRIFDEISREFPDLRTERIYVDAAALYLVRRPNTFDVLVTENMFGDILSDLAAGLIGGMGMAPSADIGDRYAVFQPSHGTAPDIAGRGIANPVATILSVAMMLEWLDHSETHRGARLVYQAVEKVLSNPENRTLTWAAS